MDDNQKMEVELQVRLILDEEATKYREQLLTQFKYIIWSITIVIVAGLAVLTYFVGKDIERTKLVINTTHEQLKASIDDKIISYRILQVFQKRLDVMAEQSVQKKSVLNIIARKAEELTERHVSAAIKETLDKELKKVGEANLSAIVERVTQNTLPNIVRDRIRVIRTQNNILSRRIARMERELKLLQKALGDDSDVGDDGDDGGTDGGGGDPGKRRK